MAPLFGKLFERIPKQVRTMAEYMGLEPEHVYRGLREANENPITRKISQTLDQNDLNYALALSDSRTMDNAMYMRDNMLPLSPHFRSYYGDSVLIDESKPMLKMADGSLVHYPEQLYHGSLNDSIEVFNSAANPRHDIGDNGEWLTNGLARAQYYAKGSPEGRVYPVYARVENPVVFDAQGERWTNINGALMENYAGLNEPNYITLDEWKALRDLYKRDRYVADNYGPNYLNSLYDEMSKYADNIQANYPELWNSDKYDFSTPRVIAIQNDIDRINNRIRAANDRALELGKMLTNHGNDLDAFAYANGLNQDGLTYTFTRDLKKKFGDRVDGVRMNNIQDGGKWGDHSDNVVVFDPSAIKSSTANNGLFRRDDPNIYHGVVALPALGSDAINETEVNPLESFALGAFPAAMLGIRTGNPIGAVIGGIGGGIAGLAGDVALTELLNNLGEAPDYMYDFDVPPETYME